MTSLAKTQQISTLSLGGPEGFTTHRLCGHFFKGPILGSTSRSARLGVPFAISGFIAAIVRGFCRPFGVLGVCCLAWCNARRRDPRFSVQKYHRIVVAAASPPHSQACSEIASEPDVFRPTVQIARSNAQLAKEIEVLTDIVGKGGLTARLQQTEFQDYPSRWLVNFVSVFLFPNRSARRESPAVSMRRCRAKVLHPVRYLARTVTHGTHK